MINYDPEKYKEATSMELSIQHVHDGTTKLSVCPTLLQDSQSPKGEALFQGVTMSRLKVKVLVESKLPAHPSPLLRLIP